MTSHSDLQKYFSGETLYGDDFEARQIEEWFEDEREGYAGLGTSATGSALSYGYNALNQRVAWRHLPHGSLGNALGLGAAYGGEFLPVLDRLDSITILEPSETLRSGELDGVSLTYVDPEPSGQMPFNDDQFGLVTSFGVLHHIPNVSLVISEMARVLKPGGFAVVREPVHSMGDWRTPRLGLTKRERGIPRLLLRSLLEENFVVLNTTHCDFPLRGRLADRNSKFGVALDGLLSKTFAANYRYHAQRPTHKVRPRSMAFVLTSKS